MNIPLSKRQVNLGAVIVCAAMMGYALYSQHVVGLDPCPMCIFQRIALIATGLVFLAGVVYNARAWGRYVFAALFLLAAGTGVALAGRHVYLQNLPPDQVPACGPSLDYMLDAFPLTEVLRKVFVGSGECAEILWQFLGLSMPAWVLIWFVILGGVGIVNSLRPA